MHNNVPIVNNDPAFVRLPLFLALLAVCLMDGIDGCVCEGAEHAVAGAGAQHEIVGKGCNVFDVEQEDVFAFFVFE